MAPRKASSLSRKSLSKIFSKDKVSKTIGELGVRLRPSRERRSVQPARVSLTTVYSIRFFFLRGNEGDG